MAVIKYIGKYVNAEDAVTCFDYTNIETAIKNIKDGAEKLEKAARRLQGAETYYTKETFSINGETFDNRIERCANYFLSTAEYMEELTELIKNARLRALNKKQVLFNDEARILDQEKIKQEAIIG